jgi:hypothetical protein
MRIKNVKNVWSVVKKQKRKDWVMQDEYTTPVSDKIKATLHRLLESNPGLTQKDQDFIIRHEKTHETYAAMRKILKGTNDET